ncbi:Teichoic acid translocation permease protein TagG [Planctomyces sp. SH-PL14]|nr:Teichoic acid translocation permease protein TagG [Planctomyces sp. SH-PL14]
MAASHDGTPPTGPDGGAAGEGARHEVVIAPGRGDRMIDWRELVDYRDLCLFLIWRGIKARYAQSVIGVGWAVVQPLFSMLVFTVVFGKLARISSDGVPYAVFNFVAMVPWTYFSNAVSDGSASLVTNAGMISKVYFPRLILPLAAVAAKLVDFVIALALLAVLLVVYRIVPTWGVVTLPLLTGLMVLTAFGMATWMTALAVQYRDVQHAMTFVLQLLMYSAPVVYPASLIPNRYELLGWTVNPQWLYALNPMVGVIEGFRSALLGTRTMPWDFLAIGSVSAALLAYSGLRYFRSREHVFADVA